MRALPLEAEKPGKSRAFSREIGTGSRGKTRLEQRTRTSVPVRSERVGHSAECANPSQPSFSRRRINYDSAFSRLCICRLLLVFLSAVRLGCFLLRFAFKPRRDVGGGDQLSRCVRVDRTGEHDQSFVELRSREVFRFDFGLECLGHSRTSPFGQYSALLYRERNIPSMRHLSPR